MKPVEPSILELAASEAEASKGQRGTVLLVDDDAIVRMLTAAGLAERGWQVVEAESGARALELFEQERPQVVALDAMMPDLDGFATCELLRRLPGGAHVPVVMLTGLDDEQSISRAYDAGATDFFVKTPGRWTLLSQRLRYLTRASRVREELVRSRADLLKVQRIARLGSWRWEVEPGRLMLSDEACSLIEMPPQAGGVGLEQIWQRVAARDRLRIERLLRVAGPERSTLNFECRIRGPDAQIRILRIEAELEYDPGGTMLAAHGAVQDVTRDRLAADQIRQLANFDVLTGLPNRRHFKEIFGIELERARTRGLRVALLLVGINRFRQINDSLGSRAGDQLLQEISRRLQGALRREDRSDAARWRTPDDEAEEWMHAPGLPRVARYGGDEFSVLLPDLHSDAELDRVAGRALAAFELPFLADGQELFMTASIGAVVFPGDGEEIDGLLGRVDLAMRGVEELGGNGCLRYAERMNTTRRAHWRMESDLHRAIELKQLRLVYQPKIDVCTGAIVGAEALMRWQRDAELVQPSDFIPAAEDSGLIVPITEWALAEACRQLDVWDRAGLRRIPISVNISGHHLRRGNLIAPVKSAMLAHQIPPGLLELEITETAMMRNLDVVQPQLQALKELGVALSIDDFGTGYSSLAYLKRLPIDILKIDRSFIGELETSCDSAALVGAILTMGQGLRLNVVAEGVETQAQMRRLADQGCRLMQGFLFARPVSAENFAALLARGAQGDWCANSKQRRAPSPASTEGGEP
jgi:predicted signal transduction protein with EAL and GGDEF domain/DNA-binding NarL/FixJ family response regulator